MGKTWVPVDAPPEFNFSNQEFTTLLRAADTGGRHSLLHYVLPPGADVVGHVHADYEETFLMLEGELKMEVGDENLTASEGMWVRAPPGVRHAFVNSTNADVRMLVTFSPGGIEELFERFADPAGTKANPSRLDAAIDEYLRIARDEHRTEYGV